MGGLLHLFDFYQAGTSRKSQAHKKHVDGLEAPRNSLELPIETSQSYDAVGDNILDSYQVKQNSSKGINYPSEAPMKKLIDEEISKEPAVRRNVPSVVARLMGMDALPSDTKPTVGVNDKKSEITRIPRVEQTRNSSIGRSPLGLKISKQTELDVSSHSKRGDPDQSCTSVKFEKPRPREHPQEKQLQKFKKDFEAYQAAKAWEHSRVVERGRQRLAQERLQKERMAQNAVLKKMTANELPVEFQGHTPQPALKTRSIENSRLRHHEYKKESYEEYRQESEKLRDKKKFSNVEQVLMTNRDEQGKSSVPTKIVILKPGPDRCTSSEHSWAGSSEIVEEEVSMEDFLQEVTERLSREIHGKNAKKDIVVRGGGIETPLSEKPSDPIKIARNIAKQARENVARERGMNLVRSESTRSYRGEVQVNAPGSPEFLNGDTRKFLSQRLRNVLKEETYMDVPNFVSESLRNSMLGDEENRLRKLDVLKRGSYFENLKDEMELQSSSFRHGQQNELLHMGEMSPRNLVRSMSAPVSGTSFGKLLLEDRHVLTGAQIRRRHEAPDNVPREVTKTRKERFNFRGKVSNFRYRFIRKGGLFGRKIQSVEESWSNESDSMKDMMSGPTVAMNFGSTQENSTEVPPSPASICSSIHEEFYKTEYQSPISAVDVPMIENHGGSQVFRDISSTLHELRRQIHQLENGTSEDMAKVEEAVEDEMAGLECQAEAYIKDLLIVSGLYDGSTDQSSSRWDPFSKPIKDWVFDKVEESYKKRPKVNEEAMDNNDLKVDHKMLFDLLNEALSFILGPAVTMSVFKRKVIGPTVKPAPCRRELLDDVWRMIHIYVYPPNDDFFYTLEGMVARDLPMNPWSEMIQDDADMIAVEIEKSILRDLINETLMDIRSW